MGVRTLNRITWTCFTRVRLAAYIVGLVVAVDASVLLHAILSDEIVSQLPSMLIAASTLPTGWRV